MDDLFCKNINLFNKKLLNEEKIKINNIIEFIEKLKENDNLNKNDYMKILDKYENILKKEEIMRFDNIQVLNQTEEYLKEQINKMIFEKKKNFLIKELELELKKIKLLKKML